MSTPTTTTIAIAPAHPMGQGSQTKGGHHNAWRAQPKFQPSDKLSLVSTVNPWRPNSLGWSFYNAVLAPCPATVSDALAVGKAKGYPARVVQGHLRWLYTWGGSYLAVNGSTYAAPAAPVVATVAPVAPVVATTGKGRGKKS